MKGAVSQHFQMSHFMLLFVCVFSVFQASSLFYCNLVKVMYSSLLVLELWNYLIWYMDQTVLCLLKLHRLIHVIASFLLQCDILILLNSEQ